jgi:uncharacterized membrane protein YphA (DoxX/SURF4 family)
MLKWERRQNQKQMALLALWISLTIEAVYLIVAFLVSHTSWQHLLPPMILTLLFGLLAIARDRARWITTLMRLVVSAEFGLSVADRFGWLGPPGNGVTWGNFAHFVSYTHQVNAFLPASVAPFLAVLATIFESMLAVALLLGIRIRLTAAGAAVLLCLFGTAMIASGLIESQFFYAVVVLASGAWLVSATVASLISVDRLLERRDHSPSPSLHTENTRF